MSPNSRIKCPDCGNNEAKRIFEGSDKDNVLYYSMQGRPVYAKNYRCGKCGSIFKKNSN